MPSSSFDILRMQRAGESRERDEIEMEPGREIVRERDVRDEEKNGERERSSRRRWPWQLRQQREKLKACAGSQGGSCEVAMAEVEAAHSGWRRVVSDSQRPSWPTEEAGGEAKATMVVAAAVVARERLVRCGGSWWKRWWWRRRGS